MAYASVTQLKTLIDIDASETSDDALLGDLIDRAQAMIEAYTSRIFEATEDTTLTFDARLDVEEDGAGRTLYLGYSDLCQITSIENGDGSAVVDYVALPNRATPYYAIKLKESADSWTYVSDPEDAISITGRWAYSVSPPADIVQACLRLAAWMYRQRDTGADADATSITAQGVVVQPSAMPRDVMQMLRPYRKVV